MNNESITYILAIVGLFAMVVIVSVVILLGCMFVKELIDNFKRQYTISRRYYKKPTAKCYCRDCVRFNTETGECADHCNSRSMSPTWFCCFAEPLKGSEFRKREKENI